MTSTSALIRTSILLLLGGLPAAAQTWETLTLSSNPTANEVVQYLRDVRVALRKAPITGVAGKPEFATELKIDRAVAEEVKRALGRVPADRIALILDECAKAESAGNVEINKTKGSALGFRTRLYRTEFTKIAITAINEMSEIPADQRDVIFRRWGEFPELVVVAATRPWGVAAEPYISADLMLTLEDKTGWAGTSRAGLAYLLHLDSPNAWQAIECLLTRVSRSLREDVYWFLVDHVRHPKIDVAAAVKRSWANLAYKEGHESYARVAAHSGILEALVWIATEVRGVKREQAVFLFEKTLPALLEPRFNSLTEAADFVQANKKKLVFDVAARKYRVRP